MKWLDLSKNGFALSVQNNNIGKKAFFLKVVDPKLAEPIYPSLISAGFKSTSINNETIFTSRLTYQARNALLSIQGATLFPTTIEAQHGNPYDGFRHVRSAGTETPSSTPSSNAQSEAGGGNPADVSPEHRSGNAESDRTAIPTSQEEPTTATTNESPGAGSSEQLGDEHLNPSGDEGNDSSNTGSGDPRDGGNEPSGFRNDVEHRDGQPGERGTSGDSREAGEPQEQDTVESSTTETEEALILEEDPDEEIVEVPVNHNPNHFYITDQITRDGGFKELERKRENFAAITLLKKLEEEGRQATNEEKEVLVKYNGWGGLSTYGTVDDYPPLNKILDSEEWDLAQSSAINAHYTAPHIVRAQWEGLVEGLGFKGGNILDPSVGVGNYLGLAPQSVIENSIITAVEKDKITAAIAKHIYPDAEIHQNGYENQKLQRNYFDLVISNIPFGDYKIVDPKYTVNHSIHNYFIIRSLDQLKPGGIAAILTSSYTMDAKDTKVRRQIHDQAHLLGAFRLPIKAHQAQANTEVSTDILIFQKRVRPRPLGEPEPEWISTHDSKYRPHWETVTIRTNSYFLENPESLMGRQSVEKAGGYNRYSRVVVEDPDRPFEQLLSDSIKAKLSSDEVQTLIKENEAHLNKPKTRRAIVEPKTVDLADTKKSLGSYVKLNGKIYQITDNEGNGTEVKGSAKSLQRISGFIDLRDTLNAHYVIASKTSGEDLEYINHRVQLNVQYDSFVAQHGFLNTNVNRKLFFSDPEVGKVLSLEKYDRENESYTKSEIFTNRVIGKPEPPKIESAHDALHASLDQYNSIDLEYMSKLIDMPTQAIIENLGDAIYLNPKSMEWEQAAYYLSGNVRDKLEEASEIAYFDPRFKRNVEALEKIQPEPILPAEIETRIGAPWISPALHEQFVADILKTSAVHVNLHKRDVDSKWIVDIDNRNIDSDIMTIELGTQAKSFTEILKNCFAQKMVKVYDTIELSDGKKRQVYNHEQTVAAQHKQETIQRLFKEFIWSRDPERAEELAEEYNRRYNSFVKPQYDGSHQTFPGMSTFYKPRWYQANAVYRALHDSTLFNHEVGVGKTFEQVATAMEMKRLGLARKPLLVIKNSTLEQINAEALRIYPTANILMVKKEDFAKKNRQLFAGKIANNNWDLVIMTHTMFEMLNNDPVFEKRYLTELKQKYKAELESIKAKTQFMTKTRSRRYGEKDIQKQLLRIEAKIKNLEQSNKDEQVYFSELGCDALFVDEADRYKNLTIISASSDISNAIKGSQRAWDLFMKINWLQEQRQDGKGVVFATGTPITNSPFEIYNIQRYLQMDDLERLGIANATDWCANFIYPKASWEPSHAASGWNLRVRQCLHNVPELMNILNTTMDTVTAQQAGIQRPEPKYETVVAPMGELQESMMAELDEMVQSKTEHIFSIMHRGSTMALDPRLVLEFDEKLPDDCYDPSSFPEDFPYGTTEIDSPNSKLNMCINDTFTAWENSKDSLGTQLLFSDIGVPNKNRKFNIYDEIKAKLIKKGIPAEEIQFIHDHETDAARAKLFEEVRQGKVRVLLGSTQKLGIGVNVQDKIVGIHHLDTPWNSAGIEQRNGRGLRFGNENDNLFIKVYTTEGTFDAFKWNLVSIKHKQLKQIVLGQSTLRKYDFEVEPSYAETAALTSGNPLMKEKLETEEKVTKLEALEGSFLNEAVRARRMLHIEKGNRNEVTETRELIKALPEPEPFEEAFFRVKTTKYGLYDKDFQTDDKDKFNMMVRNLKKKVHLTAFHDDTLSYRGIPLKHYQTIDSWDKKSTVNNWEVGGIVCSNLSKVQNIVDNKESLIEFYGKSINKYDEAITRLEAKLNERFEHVKELDSLRVQLNDINRRIELISRLDKKDFASIAHRAVTENDIEVFAHIIREFPEQLEQRDDSGFTPLDLIRELKRGEEFICVLSDEHRTYMDDQYDQRMAV